MRRGWAGPRTITLFIGRSGASVRQATSATIAQAIEHDDKQAFVTGSQHLSPGAEWRLSIFIVGIEALSAIPHDAVAAALASGVAASDSSVRIAKINRTTPRLSGIRLQCLARRHLRGTGTPLR